MIDRIQAFFRQHFESSDGGGAAHSDHALFMAAGTLLFEVARCDLNTAPEERDLVKRQLRSVFGLSEREVRDIAELAEQSAEEAVSLFPFTRLINERFSQAEKVTMVEMLWQVAYADADLDPHEEGFIRKIAELLYVPHMDFIRAKHRAQQGRLSLNGNSSDASD